MENDGVKKYLALADKIRSDIKSGLIKPGDRLPSENQLTKEFQISRHTVRKALSMLEQEGYVSAEHGRGTFCSERMKHTKTSKNIAVMTTYLSDYIFPRLIQGIDRVLSANGYSIILKSTGNSRQSEARHLEDILTKDIDGMIIEPSKSQLMCRNMNLYQQLDEYEIPYVFIQGIYEQMEDKPHILMDDCKGGYLLTKYLIKLGHKKILGIFKADDSQGKERHKGYAKALQEAGLYYDPDMVIWFHTEDRKVKPIKVVEKMLKNQIAIEGIVCYNDQIAADVIRKLTELSVKVPEDISVTGYDNSLYSRAGSIGITTIAHPQEKLGEMAAELLLEKIRQIPEEASKVARLIEPELIIRSSCQKRNS